MTFTGGAAAAARMIGIDAEPLQPSTPQHLQPTFQAAHAEHQSKFYELPRHETELDELAYLDRRYDEEMQAAKDARITNAKISHFELAYRYAVRARDLRASIQL